MENGESMSDIAAKDPPGRVEWPTLAVAALIYGGVGRATWYHNALPGWLVPPLGGYLVAWPGCLQPARVHGPATPRARSAAGAAVVRINGRLAQVVIHAFQIEPTGQERSLPGRIDDDGGHDRVAAAVGP